MPSARVLIPETDYRTLTDFIDSLKPRELEERIVLYELEYTLKKASPVPPEDFPRNVVTMNSIVRLRELATGAERVCTLIFPWEAGNPEEKTSVLSSIGSAILGRSVGDTVTSWEHRRKVQFRIEEILYQPEHVH